MENNNNGNEKKAGVIIVMIGAVGAVILVGIAVFKNDVDMKIKKIFNPPTVKQNSVQEPEKLVTTDSTPANAESNSSRKDNDTPATARQCPEGMEKIDLSGKVPSFCLDIREVSNKEYLYNSKTDKNPVVKVSWQFADRHCRGNGKRLPTEEEWIAAFSRPGGIPDLLNHEWVDGDDGYNRKLYGDRDKGIDYENYALYPDDDTNSDISFRCAKLLK